MNHKYQLITKDNAVLTAAVSAAILIAAPVPNIVAEADAAAEDVAANEAAAAPPVSAPVVPNIDLFIFQHRLLLVELKFLIDFISLTLNFFDRVVLVWRILQLLQIKLFISDQKIWVRPDSDLHIRTRCDNYLLDQLSGQLFRARGLYLHFEPNALTISTSPDVLNIEPFIKK